MGLITNVRLKDMVFIEETVEGSWQKFYQVIFVTSEVLRGDCLGSVVWKEEGMGAETPLNRQNTLSVK